MFVFFTNFLSLPLRLRVSLSSLISFFILTLLLGGVFFSCSKPLPPEVQSVSFTNVKLDENNDIETLLIIKVFNPNNKDFNVTINDLVAYKNDQPIARITKEQKINLEKKKIGFVSTKLTLKKDILLQSIFSILANQKIDITLKGTLTYHHWSNDYKINFQETFPLNLSELVQ